MALADRAYNGVINAASVNVNLDTASGTNRILVAATIQVRTPPNATAMTYNGGAPTGTIRTYSGAGITQIVSYWLDADLPASAGTYSLAVNGATTNNILGGVSWSGANQSAPVGLQTVDEVAQANTSLTVTAGTGSEYVISIRGSGGVTLTTSAGQTDVVASSNGKGMSFDPSDGTLSYTHTSVTVVAAAFGVEPAVATAPRRIRPATIIASQAATVAGTGSVA